MASWMIAENWMSLSWNRTSSDVSGFLPLLNGNPGSFFFAGTYHIYHIRVAYFFKPQGIYRQDMALYGKVLYLYFRILKCHGEKTSFRRFRRVPSTVGSGTQNAEHRVIFEFVRGVASGRVPQNSLRWVWLRDSIYMHLSIFIIGIHRIMYPYKSATCMAMLSIFCESTPCSCCNLWAIPGQLYLCQPLTHL